MAYFPNGMSQEDYEERWCSRCRHGETPDNDEGCAVTLVHLIHNYDAVDQPSVKDILDTLIPMKGLDAQKCRMFLPRHADVLLELANKE